MNDDTRCLNCGYIVNHLPEPRCPECGTPFDPQNPDATCDSAALRSVRPYVIMPLVGLGLLLAGSLFSQPTMLVPTPGWVRVPDWLAAGGDVLLFSGCVIGWWFLVRCVIAMVQSRRYRHPGWLALSFAICAVTGPGSCAASCASLP